MNKALIAIAILVVVVGSGVYLFGRGNTKSNTPPPPSETNIEDSANQVIEEESLEEVRTIEISGKNFEFSSNNLTFKAGEKIKLVFASTQGFHDFVVDELNIKTDRVNTGESTSIEFVVPDKPGVYAFYCSVGNHRSLGMEGEVIVK